MHEVARALASVESKEWFFEFLNKRFSHDVFLSPDSMNDQLNLIGIGFNNVMVVAYPLSTEKQSRQHGRRVIQDLYDRRNAIAHQVDRKHESAEQNDIDRAFVEQCISDVEKIVNVLSRLKKLLTDKSTILLHTIFWQDVIMTLIRMNRHLTIC